MTQLQKQTENLLYNYPNYKNYIALKYLDIADLKREPASRCSPSIVLYSGGKRQKRELKIAAGNEGQIKALKLQTEKTARLVLKIETALSLALKEEEKRFVELKYFENQTIEELCTSLCISRSSVYRIRSSVLCKLSTVLYGVQEAEATGQ